MAQGQSSFYVADHESEPSRREWMKQTGISFLSLGTVFPLLTCARPAVAQEAESLPTAQEGLVSTDRLAELLHAVPTFTIVDQKGVPFMVVGEDAKVTGYFFVDFQEAQRILRVANESADAAIKDAIKDDPTQAAELMNPWKDARISTVPLDFSVTLISKSLNDKRSGGNYFQVAPSAAEIENALTVTGKEDLAEGKVPLFYYEDFTLPDVATDTKPSTPLYFEKKQLEAAYRKVNGRSPSLPPTKVTELFALLLEMVKPGGTDLDLQNLVFVPPPNSVSAAKACQKRARADAPPFLLGQRNIIL